MQSAPCTKEEKYMPSPKDTGGPVVKSGPTRGDNRSRNQSGEWRKKRSDSGKSKEKDKKRSGCFITSAACAHRGLPDDCKELETLRRFRDEQLLRTPDGRALVARYYDIAPKIATALENEIDFDFVWDCIQRCIRHIDNGDHQRALSEYRSMVSSLSTRFSND